MRILSAFLFALVTLSLGATAAPAQSGAELAAAARLLQAELPEGRVVVAREKQCLVSDPCPGATWDMADLKPVLETLGATPASAASIRTCGESPDTCRLHGAEALVLLGPGSDGGVSAIVYSASGSRRAPVARVTYVVAGGKIVKEGES